MSRLLKTMAGAAVGAIALAGTALASPGYTTGGVTMRAGPGGDYPPIVHLRRGTPIDVNGCLDGYDWCDVYADGTHGFVRGDRIDVAYEGRRVLLPEFGVRIGLPIISFSVGDYWGRYYRNRPFFGERERFGDRGFGDRGFGDRGYGDRGYGDRGYGGRPGPGRDAGRPGYSYPGGRPSGPPTLGNHPLFPGGDRDGRVPDRGPDGRPDRLPGNPPGRVPGGTQGGPPPGGDHPGAGHSGMGHPGGGLPGAGHPGSITPPGNRLPGPTGPGVIPPAAGGGHAGAPPGGGNGAKGGGDKDGHKDKNPPPG